MTTTPQDVLIGLLADDDALTYLARTGLNMELLPSERLRPVVQWALDYRTEGGKAPTVNAISQRFGDVLKDEEIDIEWEPEETIEWALEELRGNYVRYQATLFVKEFSEQIAVTAGEERIAVLGSKAAELAALAQKVATRRTQVELTDSADELWEQYQEIKSSGGQPRGMVFGLEEIDSYTQGIHDGEMAVFAAPAKMGKSFWADFVAYQNFMAGKPVGLWTLENSIDMTKMRIACFALQISIDQMQRGELDEEDEEALKEWVFDHLHKNDNGLYLFHSEEAMRSPHAIVQQARALDLEVMMVDQLSHMKPTEAKRNLSRASEVSDMVHDLRTAISTGNKYIPCGLVVQVNREGIKTAEKTGAISMYHMADSSGIERACDWLFTLNMVGDQEATHRITLATVASRRAMTRDFELMWNIDIGRIGFIREIAA